jgi:filamentous hemagglutinin family protein
MGIEARSRSLRVALLGCSAWIAPALVAAQSILPDTRPRLDRVVAGGITVRQEEGRTHVTQPEARGIVEWRSFDVGSRHEVRFAQPSSSAITLNRVTGPDPSTIAGRIRADGQVAIVNQSGVVFARGAQVEAAGLIVSAANIANQNFLAGRMIFDQQPRPDARVENAGDINIREAGLAALVAPQVANRGNITARLGRIALAGAETHVVDLHGDGLMAIEVTGPVRQAATGALVTNTGRLEAAGGSVQLSAAAVDGIVQDLVRGGGRIAAPADPATGRPGRVVLAGTGGALRIEGHVDATASVAGQRGGTVEAVADRVWVADGARVDASGPGGGGRIALGRTLPDAPTPRLARRTGTAAGSELRADAMARGPGGAVVLDSQELTAQQGAVSARGGPNGGNGGFVEVSSRGSFRPVGMIDVSAAAGAPGTVLYDPVVVRIVSEGGPGAQVGLTPPPAEEAVLGANPAIPEAFLLAGQVTGQGARNVVVQATRDIFVDAPLTARGSGSLALLAGNDVEVNQPIRGFNGLTLRAEAGQIRLNAGLLGNGATVLQAGGAVLMTPSVRIAAGITATTLDVTAGGDIAVGVAGSDGGSAPFGAIQVTQAARLVAGYRWQDGSRIPGSAASVLLATPTDFVQPEAPILLAALDPPSPLASGFSNGDLSVVAAGDLTVGRAISGFAGALLRAETGSLRLTAGLDLTGAATLQAGGSIAMRRSFAEDGDGGRVPVPAGIRAAALAVTGGGAVTVGDPTIGDGFDSLVVQGPVSLTAGADWRSGAPIPGSAAGLELMNTDTIVTGPLNLAAQGDLRLESSISAPGVEVTGSAATGDVLLAARARISSQNFNTETGGPVTLRAGRDILIDGVLGGDTIPGANTLEAGRNVSINGVAVGEPLRVTAGGSIGITGTFASRGTEETLLAAGTDGTTGAVIPGATAALVIDRPLSVNGPLRLQAGTGGITQTARIATPALTLLTTGNASLSPAAAGASNGIEALAGARVGGTLSLELDTPSTAPFAATAEARAIEIRTPRNLALSRTGLAAGERISLQVGGLSAAGGATLRAPLVEVAPYAAAPVALAGTGSPFALSAATLEAIAAETLRVGRATYQGATTTSAQVIRLAGPLSYSGTLDLRSLGEVTQAPGAAVRVGTLSFAAGGAVTLAEADNQMGALGGSAAGGPVTLTLDAPRLVLPGGQTLRGTGSVSLFNRTGNITVDGTVAGSAVTLSAGGTVAVNGFSALAQAGDLTLQGKTVDVTGLISATGRIVITAADSASLSGIASAPVSGLVATAPRVTFGGLNAVDTAVLLQLGGGGQTSGLLDAAALTIAGGASATLTGRIARIADGSAAALVSRLDAAGGALPAPPPQAEQFVFNGCTIAVATCQIVVIGDEPLPVVIQLVPLPLAGNPLAVLGVLDPAALATAPQRLRPPLPDLGFRPARDRSSEEEFAPPDIRREDY